MRFQPPLTPHDTVIFLTISPIFQTAPCCTRFPWGDVQKLRLAQRNCGHSSGPSACVFRDLGTLANYAQDDVG